MDLGATVRAAAFSLTTMILGCGAHRLEAPIRRPETTHLADGSQVERGWSWEIPVPNEFVADLAGAEGARRCQEQLAAGVVSCSLPVGDGITLVVWGSGKAPSLMVSRDVQRGLLGESGLPDWQYMSSEQAARAMERFQPQAE